MFLFSTFGHCCSLQRIVKPLPQFCRREGGGTKREKIVLTDWVLPKAPFTHSEMRPVVIYAQFPVISCWWETPLKAVGAWHNPQLFVSAWVELVIRFCGWSVMDRLSSLYTCKNSDCGYQLTLIYTSNMMYVNTCTPRYSNTLPFYSGAYVNEPFLRVCKTRPWGGGLPPGCHHTRFPLVFFCGYPSPFCIWDHDCQEW